jgi:hypothetical protein
MPKIINLSAVHTLRSIPQVISAFATLCDQYSHSLFACCPSFFNLTHSANCVWVMHRYIQFLDTLINPYKLGKLTTDQFLEGLLSIFPFMADENLQISQRDMRRLDATKNSLWSLNKVGRPSTRDYAKALLEEAWNSIIAFEEKDVTKLQQLWQNQQDDADPIYFISNTNELNIFKIRQWLHTEFPEIISADSNNNAAKIVYGQVTRLEIGQNKYMLLSYLYHTFKTQGLLQAVTQDIFHGELGDIVVISQYEKDRSIALKMGISNNKIYSPEQYFQFSVKKKDSVTTHLLKK